LIDLGIRTDRCKGCFEDVATRLQSGVKTVESVLCQGSKTKYSLNLVLSTEHLTTLGNLSRLDVVWRDIIESSGVKVVVRLGSLGLPRLEALPHLHASVRLLDDALARRICHVD
jgi:hypothetical protein